MRQWLDRRFPISMPRRIRYPCAADGNLSSSSRKTIYSPPSAVRSLILSASSANAACPSNIVYNHGPTVSGFMPTRTSSRQQPESTVCTVWSAAPSVATSREAWDALPLPSSDMFSEVTPELHSTICSQHLRRGPSPSLHTALAHATADVQCDHRSATSRVRMVK